MEHSAVKQKVTQVPVPFLEISVPVQDDSTDIFTGNKVILFF